jgi:methylenetetrahydrofolate dehydrogenase (NADP+) / methenyltetrahydrofolate cyclohydrolase
MDGKTVSEDLYLRLQGEVTALKEKNVHPKLVIILVGEDQASLSYIRSKRKASDRIGVTAELLSYKPDEINTKRLIAKIHELNEDETVNGILVQMPLPAHIYAPDVTKAIDPKKDVDGFTAYNLGKMFLSAEFEDLVPCTPLGIIRMLEFYKIPLEGLNAVVVGASNLVGKPMSTMLLNRRATVTVCNSRTKDLASHTRKADLLVVAVGKVGLITADMVKEGAVVVDVGINRNAEGKMVGDVDFMNVSKKASYITPVPGGCGLMTVACLMENVYKATLKQLNNPVKAGLK